MTPEHQIIPRPLILASSSPRRAELLQNAGFSFEVLSPDVEESHEPEMKPGELTELNAGLKALAVARLKPRAVAVGADTLVYLDDRPLGKPATLEEAGNMLRELSGRSHHVCTGVCLAWNGGGSVQRFHVLSRVVFKVLTNAQISAYHALVNPLDKAGAYGIQEHGEMIVESHEGSWTNIMGLPMEALTPVLKALLLAQ